MRPGWSHNFDLDGISYYSRAIGHLGVDIWLDVELKNGEFEPQIHVDSLRVWRGFLTPTLEEAQIAAENRVHDMLSACLAELPGLTSDTKEVPDEDLDLPF